MWLRSDWSASTNRSRSSPAKSAAPCSLMTRVTNPVCVASPRFSLIPVLQPVVGEACAAGEYVVVHVGDGVAVEGARREVVQFHRLGNSLGGDLGAGRCAHGDEYSPPILSVQVSTRLDNYIHRG